MKFKIFITGMVLVLLVGSVFGERIDESERGFLATIFNPFITFLQMLGLGDIEDGYGYGYEANFNVEKKCEDDKVIRDSQVLKECSGKTPHCSKGECICSCERLASYKMREDTKERFEKIISEIEDCSKNVKEFETDNFVIKSPDGYADCIGKFLEFHRYRLGEEYIGKELKNWENKIEVQVLSILDEGDFGGGARFTGDEIRIEGDFKSIIYDFIPHELMHLILNKEFGFDNLKEDWSLFEEGLAQTAEITVGLGSTSDMDTLIISLNKEKEIISTKDIFEKTDFDGRYVYLIYGQAKSMSEFLLSLDQTAENRKKLFDSYIQYLNNRDLDKFFGFYGFKNYEEFEKEWIKYLRTQIGEEIDSYKNLCNILKCEETGDFKEWYPDT